MGKELDGMEIKATTRLTGVFGYPVRHSLSPIFQNAAFQYLGLDMVYVALEVKPEDLEVAVKALKVFDFVGVNVTIPHKKAVVSLVDELDGEAQESGVVNTICCRGGRLKGYSTDGQGFIRSLKEEGRFSPENKSALVLGAGGSAHAVCGALVRSGIGHLFLCNRTREKAVALADHLKKNLSFTSTEVIEFSQRHRKAVWKDVDLLVNTTSVGMKENDPLLVREENLHPGLFVYDLIYNRLTELLRNARKLKLPHLNGLAMLVYQGGISFELWTGRKAPLAIMKKALAKYRGGLGKA